MELFLSLHCNSLSLINIFLWYLFHYLFVFSFVFVIFVLHLGFSCISFPIICNEMNEWEKRRKRIR